MNYVTIQKLAILLIILAVLLVGCTSSKLSESGIETATAVSNSSISPTGTAKPSPTPRPSTEIVHPTARPKETLTLAPTITPEPSPLAAPTTEPAPVVDIPCRHNDGSGLPSQASPAQIDLDGLRVQRVAVAYPYLYLATGQYLGKFDISEPANPDFLGFWALPQWAAISTLLVNNGVAYFTNESELILLNLSAQCHFETIAVLEEIPLQTIYHLEIEADRLYVGGISPNGQERQVIIFSIEELTQPKELGIVTLGEVPTTWSVFEKKIYALGDKLMKIDVSDPTNAQTEIIDGLFDPEVLSHTPAEFVQDSLYLLLAGRQVTIIENLKGDEPTIQQNPDYQVLFGDLTHFLFQVSENYIFLGIRPCAESVNECVSRGVVFDAKDASEILVISELDDYFAAYGYYEITQDIIYVFADESLLVFDISDKENPLLILEIGLLAP